MSDEFRLQVSLQARSGNLDYRSSPTSFSADLEATEAKGPTPGAIRVPAGGVAVSFSELTTPGFVILQNLDDTNYVEYGIRDPGTGVFYPLGELMSGEINLLRLSRNLLEEYTNTGTGTTSPGNQFWLKASVDPCTVVVSAFER